MCDRGIYCEYILIFMVWISETHLLNRGSVEKVEPHAAVAFLHNSQSSFLCFPYVMLGCVDIFVTLMPKHMAYER